MSLKSETFPSIPLETRQVARSAFPNGSLCLRLLAALGRVFNDVGFADLYPVCGQPAYAPWRLALIVILQFAENLSDRQAAEAVRARIDWKYLLALKLTDPGFDFSVLSEFRSRLLAGGKEELLLSRLLEQCRAQRLLKARGLQRTDSTRVLAAVRELNRLELVGETLRAALNELAAEVPEWLRSVAPIEWFDRYSRRIEDSRLPSKNAERTAYAETVGQDGYLLLHLLETKEAPARLTDLPRAQLLRRVWDRHYRPGEDEKAVFIPAKEIGSDSEVMDSPYDPEARFRTRFDTCWTGYMVHVTETCDEDRPHLITHVETTPATVHEARCTENIHQALDDKGLPPERHLADAAYVDAGILLSSKENHDIQLIGPARPDPSWQARIEGGYTADQFEIDWAEQKATCPEGEESSGWGEYANETRGPYVKVRFPPATCRACPSRHLCTRAKKSGRQLILQAEKQHKSLAEIRTKMVSEDGKQLYQKRAGVEGTLSQGTRAFGLRQTRYIGLAKTRLQHLATAAAVNLARINNWLMGIPLAQTRTSAFAALAP